MPARLIMHGAPSCGRVRWDVHPEDARHIAHGKGAPGQFRQEQLLIVHCLVLLRFSRDDELAPQVDEALCGVLLAAACVRSEFEAENAAIKVQANLHSCNAQDEIVRRRENS